MDDPVQITQTYAPGGCARDADGSGNSTPGGDEPGSNGSSPTRSPAPPIDLADAPTTDPDTNVADTPDVVQWYLDCPELLDLSPATTVAACREECQI